jgi:phosphoglycolate phosphatase-like HAD superfamily hydrolase
VTAVTHIARWDLDKTYLRTEFDSLRDILRTALERPDEKRTNPGASTLLREMVRAGIRVHILSGSPEQMRRRLEDKLRLDGITWDTFTLKPNLQNLLRLRFRAVRDQLGYKLPALMKARAAVGDGPEAAAACRETLFGDDAEADAYVYSLYADILRGRVTEDVLVRVLERGRVYDDVLAATLEIARSIEPVDAVERILIHLEQQTPPDDFRTYGSRVVPFYNYLQAAFVLHEDGRLAPGGVLRVAVELVTEHHFDGDALARSYLDLARRGHLRGTRVDAIAIELDAWLSNGNVPASDELRAMVARLPVFADAARAAFHEKERPLPDYEGLVLTHNARRHR